MDDESERESSLTQRKRFKLQTLIHENGKIVGEFWRYNPGWDDAVVAQEVGGLKRKAVAAIRRSTFGNLEKAGRSVPQQNSKYVEVIESLNATMQQLTARIGFLENSLAELGFDIPVKKFNGNEKDQYHAT